MLYSEISSLAKGLAFAGVEYVHGVKLGMIVAVSGFV